jgi:hypothetical protein
MFTSQDDANEAETNLSGRRQESEERDWSGDQVTNELSINCPGLLVEWLTRFDLQGSAQVFLSAGCFQQG